MRRLPLLLVAATALTGCVTHKIAPSTTLQAPPYRQATAEEVLAAWDGWASRLETVSASGHLTVSDLRAGQAKDVSVRLVARRGGRLYLKATVAVVTALEVVADGEQFWFSLPSKKTIWTGSARTTHGVTEVVGTDAPYRALRPRDITEALLPGPIAPAAEDGVAFEASPEAFTLTVTRPSGTQGRVVRRVALTRQTLAPLAVWTFDDRGELQSEARVSGPAGPGRVVVIRRPAEGYEARFTFDTFDTAKAVPDRAFTPRLPADYTVKHVD